LAEETGFKAQELSIIGNNLSHHRRSTAKNYVVMADNTIEDGKTQLENEQIGTQTVLMIEAEINDAIARSDIIQKNALAARAIYTSSLLTQ
jgi:hypothetical protein